MGFLVSGLMAFPDVYSRVTLFLRGKKRVQYFVDQYVRPGNGDRFLDIGCGTGDILFFLPDVDYYGFDLNRSYIEMAKSRFSSRGKFFNRPVSRDILKGEKNFDIVLAMGILHHLDDDKARELFELASRLLRPGGRLVTYDGCYTENQSGLARFFLWLDQGNFVREKSAYENLARHAFSSVETHVRNDLLTIPYTIIILECEK